MLDLAKILRDIDDLGRERAAAFSGLESELSAADSAIRQMCDEQDFAQARISEAKTSWLTANFDEPPDKACDLPPLTPAHSVIAVDGSQITPDKNEAVLCYLLNSASVILHYGNGKRPSSRVNPRLCHREEDLFEDYGGKRVQVADKLLGIRRTIAESNELEYAVETAEDTQAVALWDGSLIRWSLENEPAEYKKRVLAEYLRAFEAARSRRIPIAGYISDPGSRDLVNSMKVMLCDMTPVDCDKCPHKESGDPPPCDDVGRLTDSSVFRTRLKEGQRSVLLTSSSHILDHYGPHTVRAFYLNTGREVARVEIPLWVAEDDELLNLTHAVCFDQAVKGRGYPIALAEAHEHAVIKGPERAAFYEAVERSLIKHGARITRSLKRISKGW